MRTRILASLIVVLALTGCTSGVHTLTLVETKSPVQLLRNDAWYRLPDVMIKSDSETSDVSVGCDQDATGVLRAWRTFVGSIRGFRPRPHEPGRERSM